MPEEFFASGDGKRRRLNVETYGGRTWISEYGFLLGLNASYLGPTYEFLGMVQAGKFQNTLPQRLAELGYVTVANYPSPLSFMNTGRFYRSLGFDVLNNPETLGLRIIENNRPRDREYYQRVLEDIQSRTDRQDRRPGFYFVWSTATHYPYWKPMFPDVRSNEIVQGDQAAEFARRQRIANDDLKWFQRELGRKFPSQKFVLAGFGDHHPIITSDYFDVNAAPNVRPRDETETLHRTYYRIVGINFDPDYASLTDEIEIGYLADSIMSAARLPLGPSFAARAWLRRRCLGLWLTCPETPAVVQTNSMLSEGPSSIFR